ncbi:MAG: PepSY domain-containing protein [Proteobacteria bacterium]|nr:PepSY domain-containing protein [Pseudomonadota bacterium]
MRHTRPQVRKAWVWLHRWVGLTMAFFLFVVGLTGAVLAFNTELERVFAPQLFAHRQPGPPLSLSVLAERAQALVPDAEVQAVFRTEPDQVSVAFTPHVDPRTGHPRDLGFTEFFVDPWTGRELGRRERGDLAQGRVNLMPFLYELHWTMLMGAAGQIALGAVALVWTLDVFNGVYLTLPTTLSDFWRRWRKAWGVKWRAAPFRINFDLHRAGGLWLAPLLFVFAWSSVMMNIRPVYEPVMGALFDYRSPLAAYEAGGRPNPHPRLGWRQAEALGRAYMQREARLEGFTAGEPLSLMYLPDVGAYGFDVRGSRDIFERSPKGGSTTVMLDGDTGAFRSLSQPTGEHLGNTIESWLYALHMARVFGRPYQVLVCIAGLVTAMLSVTGAYIFLRKRRPHRAARGGPIPAPSGETA